TVLLVLGLHAPRFDFNNRGLVHLGFLSEVVAGAKEILADPFAQHVSGPRGESAREEYVASVCINRDLCGQLAQELIERRHRRVWAGRGQELANRVQRPPLLRGRFLGEVCEQDGVEMTKEQSLIL